MLKQILLSLFILLPACDIIDYHPYDGRISVSERNINKKNIPIIETVTKDKDTIRFVLIGDTQKSYDETADFVKHINAQKDSIDFIIHGGDYTEFGLTNEFEWAVKILQDLEIPYVGLIGNHDLLGNGEDVYLELFGEENFAFIAGNTKFICLNTNALESDYSNPVPNFTFLKQELQDTTRHYARTIVAMHARPGSEQFDNNVKDIFQEYILKFPSLQFCLNAHNHQLQKDDLFGDGIIYYGCSNIAKRNYLLFTLTPNNYTYEVINF